MTIKELYTWAKENNCLDYEVSIECYDGYGSIFKAWLDDDNECLLSLLPSRKEVRIKCCD